MKTGSSLSKMRKSTALHTEGTVQVSEWLNISDTVKKLYEGKSNRGIAIVITTKLQTGTYSCNSFLSEKQRQIRKGKR